MGITRDWVSYGYHLVSLRVGWEWASFGDGSGVGIKRESGFGRTNGAVSPGAPLTGYWKLGTSPCTSQAPTRANSLLSDTHKARSQCQEPSHLAPVTPWLRVHLRSPVTCR